MFDVKPVVSLKLTDCGPTCLKMLLDYYGTDVDLDTLITECNVGVDGCTAKDLNQVGRLHGLDMTAYPRDPEDPDDIYEWDRPAIVWWKYSHFCVYCGLDDNGQVVICNPDRGRYPISKSLFQALYSGIALVNGKLPGTVTKEGEENA